jgi:hypothetical protein
MSNALFTCVVPVKISLPEKETMFMLKMQIKENFENFGPLSPIRWDMDVHK